MYSRNCKKFIKAMSLKESELVILNKRIAEVKKELVSNGYKRF
jgi:hypothetical protein